MRIGEPFWQWVTLDSIGVPTGGVHGDVKRFHDGVKEMGLDLAWSRLYDIFFLFRQHKNGKIQTLQGFASWSEPVTPDRLTMELLRDLRSRRHWFGRQSKEVLRERRAQSARNKKQADEEHRATLLTECMDELMDPLAYKVGMNTRKMIVVPERRLVGVG